MAARLGFDVLRTGRDHRPLHLPGAPANHISGRPLLITLDDANAWDPAFLSASGAVALPDSRPQLHVLTCYSDNGVPNGESFRRGAANTLDVSLDRLPEQAVCKAVEDVVGTVPCEALMSLLACADGVPATFMRLVHGLIRDGRITAEGKLVEFASDELPRCLLDLVSDTVLPLGEQTREMLVAAAVLGRENNAEDVAHLLEVPVVSLVDAFVEASNARVLSADSEMVAFRHEPVRRALLQALPINIRKALHRQAADMLLRRGAPALLAARHLAVGAQQGDPQAVAVMARAAGEIASNSPRDALKFATLGLELVSPEDEVRPLLLSITMEAYVRLGLPNRAVELTSQAPPQRPNPTAQARIRYWLSIAQTLSGRPQEGSDTARSVLAEPGVPEDLRGELVASEHFGAALQAKPATAPDDTRDSAASVAVHGPRSGGDLVVRAIEQWRRGQVTQALRSCRDALRCDYAGSGFHVDARAVLFGFHVNLRQPAEARSALAELPQASAWRADGIVRILGARLALGEGNYDDALAEAEAVLANTGTDSPLSRYALTVVGTLSLWRGASARLAEYQERLRAVGASSPWRWSAAGAWLEAQIAAAFGDREALLGALDTVDGDEASRLVLLIEEPAAAAWLARAHIKTDAPERAMAVSDAMQRLAKANAEVTSITAAAAHVRGVCEGNVGALESAVALHRDLWARASATEDTGTLLTRSDRDQAIRHLDEAGAGYRAIGAQRDAARIRHRLRDLGVVRRHWKRSTCPHTEGTRLTETERKVAELVADGLTNRQVAKAMYVSPHTIAFHLRQIYRKLRIHSRVELTRWIHSGTR
ncbi:LuxR family transcriptional regulator [Streptomyces sp. MUM 2J]|uniref:helix-turn-helix transcriptional regulator n=1 Tax=Streptomyces sp. MUM 2J TaxID=2791987 RepID=UPI001F034196|nr:LuxR C-terminal-related transcriptional regulator [Streptomyces sp. MUM 2J]MCH0566884.1 hypothetical protein [Streptomyces sp. MUM 2J]